MITLTLDEADVIEIHGLLIEEYAPRFRRLAVTLAGELGRAGLTECWDCGGWGDSAERRCSHCNAEPPR